jgi:hypothetical protein
MTLEVATSIHIVTPLSRLFRDFTECTLDFDTIYCYIDALDECGESITFLLRSISNVIQSNAFPIKFLLTSRPSPRVSQDFVNTAITIQVPASGTASNIERYVLERLDKFHLSTDSQRRSQLVDKLVKESRGIFL